MSKPSKPAVIVTLVLVGIAVAGTTWWLVRRGPHRQDLVLYGNVDLRQVELAFNNNERIAAVLVQEGDRVKRGQILARLNTNRLEPQVAQAEATAAAQREAVARLHNGSRPQEIAEAQANVESAKADAINARGQYERRKTLEANSIVSRQDLENAKMPRGNKINTAMKSTNSIIGVQLTGMNGVAMPSISPSATPPISAPAGLPSPPSTVTTKLFNS